MSDKIRCYSITLHKGASPFIAKTAEEVIGFFIDHEELENMGDEAKMHITIAYFTQEELDDLPEWDGP